MVLCELENFLYNKVSNILHEKGSISPDMALRISRAFDTSPELWMRLQESYNFGMPPIIQMNGGRHRKFVYPRNSLYLIFKIA